MANIAFSKEQEDIFEYAEHGVLNMIVQAVAGAGKTTTLVECANRIENSKKILHLAHNRSTKDTLKERIGDKSNVMICTLHGLGWRLFVEHFDFTPTIEEDKYRNYIEKERKRITDLYGESENLKVVPIDGKRMILSGNESIFWLDYIKIKFGGIQ